MIENWEPRLDTQAHSSPLTVLGSFELMVGDPRITSWRDSSLEDQQQTGVLVHRCLAGDAAAWEGIVRLFNKRIYNLCYRFTNSPDDAEDLTQEVFIRVYRTMGSYNVEKGAFSTWLTTLTRNMLVDHFRRNKQARMTDSMDAGVGSDEDAQPLSDKIADRGPSPDDRLASQETQKLVRAALARISPDLREAV